MSQPIQTDVIIIGGGLSGLAAALKIKDANEGSPLQTSYLVLESDAQRLGGRTYTRDNKDFGGGYIGGSQNYILFLIRRYGLKTLQTYLPPDKSWLYRAANGLLDPPYAGDDPLQFPGGLNALGGLLKLDGLALEVRRHLLDPENSPLASFDQITVQQYIDSERQANQQNPATGMTATTAEVFTTSVRSAFSLEPREISFFFLLYYAATAGSYSALVDVEGGTGAAEATRLTFGTRDLIDKMVADIGANNIKHDAKVKSVAYDAHGVTVTTTRGQVYKAKRAIVAMSPPVSGLIDYQPAFSSGDGLKRAQLCTEMGKALGRTIKGFVNFRAPVWRGKKLMGYSLSAADYKQYPLDWTLDNCWTKPGDDVPTRYSLMTFIVGDAADYWSKQPLKARASAVLADIKATFAITDADLLDPRTRNRTTKKKTGPFRPNTVSARRTP